MDPETYETAAGSVSNFMRWAERRLAEEVEKNDKIEKALKKQKSPTDLFLTNNEKILIIQHIHKYRAEGKTVTEACKIFNIHPNTYHNWRRHFKIPVFKNNVI